MIKDELSGLKGQKAFLGLEETLNWVLEMVEDPTNDLRSVPDFIAYIVRDKLYVEKYLLMKN